MSQQRPSFLASLSGFFRSLFGSSTPSTPPQPPPPAPPPADLTKPVLTDEPLVPLSPRILVIVYDPIVDQLKNTHLIEWGVKNYGWKTVDELLAGYIGDVNECSGGAVKYSIVDRITVDGFPPKLDGKRFTALEYIDLYSAHREKYKEPDDRFDYNTFVKEFNLTARVDSGEIDEVWLFAFPFAGNYESVMCGTGAFWCNGPVIENTPGRRFVIMGFSYERGVGEMEEDLGHRAESLLAHVYHAEDFLGWLYSYDRSNPNNYVKLDPTRYDAAKFAETNLLAKFMLYDRIAPGGAQCGTVHYAPNSQKDYDWGNKTPVVTYADDWLTFPNLPNTQKMENTGSWGGGDIRGHHRWWFSRFPKVAGRWNGVRMNWWSYICNVTDHEFDDASNSGMQLHIS